jgi:hypothetical protein
MMKQNGKWGPYAPCHAYRDAELAACALVTKPDVTECHIVRIDKDSSRVIAKVTAEPASGWPNGKAKVERD